MTYDNSRVSKKSLMANVFYVKDSKLTRCTCFKSEPLTVPYSNTVYCYKF